MSNTLRPEEPETVDCEVCLTEIPRDSAVTAESSDYVVHFCGLTCYQRWLDRQRQETGAH